MKRETKPETLTSLLENNSEIKWLLFSFLFLGMLIAVLVIGFENLEIVNKSNWTINIIVIYWLMWMFLYFLGNALNEKNSKRRKEWKHSQKQNKASTT